MVTGNCLPAPPGTPPTTPAFTCKWDGYCWLYARYETQLQYLGLPFKNMSVNALAPFTLPSALQTRLVVKRVNSN